MYMYIVTIYSRDKESKKCLLNCDKWIPMKLHVQKCIRRMHICTALKEIFRKKSSASIKTEYIVLYDKYREESNDSFVEVYIYLL